MKSGRIKPNTDPYDELTLRTGEVIRLASLLEAIGQASAAPMISHEALFDGCSAVSRVIVEKVQVIEACAAKMNGGAR